MMHASSVRSPVALSRGVWTAPYLSQSGHPLLIAVDQRGRYVAQAQVFRSDDEADVAEMLWRVLDERDPVVRRIAY